MKEYRQNSQEAIRDWLRDTQARPASPYWYPLASATYGEEEIFEALESLCNQRTTMGEKTAAFEAAFARYVGASDAVMVNSGSSADLLLAFLLANPAAPRLQPGDEILVPAVTWPTQVWSPIMAGFRAKLVDVDPTTLNVAIDALESAIGPKTRAISVVHIMGNPCDMDAIMSLARRHELLVIEDCCESLGARWGTTTVGSFGLGGAFSFFFSHHITTMEGGMVIANDPAIADHLRLLRAHGWLRGLRTPTPTPADVDQRYTFLNWGFNLRPTELQAGFGLRQLERIEGFTAARNQLASHFYTHISRSPWLTGPRVHPNAHPIWMSLPLMVSRDAPFTREQLTTYLESEGVETRPIVTGNLARQPAAHLFPGLVPNERLAGAELVHTQGLYLGLHPMVSEEMMGRLLTSLDTFLKGF